MKPDNEFEQLALPLRRLTFAGPALDIPGCSHFATAGSPGAGPAADEVAEPDSRRDRDAADRYATAFQDADVAALVEANGQPAFGTYLRGEDGERAAHAIQVLDIADGPLPPAGDAPRQVTRISMFPGAGLFPAFGLPVALPAAVPAARD